MTIKRDKFSKHNPNSWTWHFFSNGLPISRREHVKCFDAVRVALIYLFNARVKRWITWKNTNPWTTWSKFSLTKFSVFDASARQPSFQNSETNRVFAFMTTGSMLRFYVHFVIDNDATKPSTHFESCYFINCASRLSFNINTVFFRSSLRSVRRCQFWTRRAIDKRSNCNHSSKIEYSRWSLLESKTPCANE